MQVRFELAAFLEKAGLRTQATAELLAILNHVPNDTAARKRIGRLLLDYGSPQQSADVFRSLVSENNGDAEAYSGLGAAELAQAQYIEAREAFRSALRLNHTDAATGRELALCERILEMDPAVPGIDAPERYPPLTPPAMPWRHSPTVALPRDRFFSWSLDPVWARPPLLTAAACPCRHC